MSYNNFNVFILFYIFIGYRTMKKDKMGTISGILQSLKINMLSDIVTCHVAGGSTICSISSCFRSDDDTKRFRKS